MRRTAGVAVTIMLAGLLGIATTATTTTGSAAAATPDPGTYQALKPARILDTRSGDGTAARRVAGHTELTFTVLGRGGIPPAGVSAVVFDLAAVQPVASGYISAFPAGRATPTSSSLNFAAGQTRAHLVVVAPGAKGQVTLLDGSDGSVDLLGDVAGYVTSGTPSAGGEFGSLDPARFLDTRTGLGAPKAPIDQSSISVPVAGRAGIPANGVSAIVVNLTATDATSDGYLLATGSTHSAGSSTVNFVTGHSSSNLAIVPVSSAGTIAVTATLTGRVDVVADVAGYFTAGSPAAAGRFGALNATRLLDTRLTRNAITAGGSLTLAVAGHQYVPAAGATAAALNVTVASPSRGGYLTVYPTASTRPSASSVNFAHATVANQILATLGTSGQVTIYNGSAASVQVVVDVSGFIGPIPGPYVWSARAPIPGAHALDYVSCTGASSTFCLAVDDRGAVFVFDGNSWTSGPGVDPSIEGLSCVNSRFCVAFTAAAAVVYDGTSWTSTDLATQSDVLTAVSCTSPTSCLVVSSGESTSVGFIYDGSVWKKTDTLGSHFGGEQEIVASCTSPTSCLAVTEFGDTDRFDGTAWHAVSAIAPGGEGPLDCVTATFCVRITDMGAVVFDGSHWSDPVGLAIPANSGTRTTLSCPSTTSCVLSAGHATLFYDGMNWTSPTDVDPASLLTGISCSPAGRCVGIDDSSGAVVGTRRG